MRQLSGAAGLYTEVLVGLRFMKIRPNSGAAPVNALPVASLVPT